MMPTVLTAMRLLGFQGAIICAVLLFYEGVPGVNYVTPYLRFVPAAGPLLDDMAQGRVGRARSAGALDERLVWQERERRAQIVREDEKRRAQTAVDAAEREYLARQFDDAIRISDLEKALEDEQTSTAALSCGPAISRRLRDAIDRVGRD